MQWNESAAFPGCASWGSGGPFIPSIAPVPAVVHRVPGSAFPPHPQHHPHLHPHPHHHPHPHPHPHLHPHLIPAHPIPSWISFPGGTGWR